MTRLPAAILFMAFAVMGASCSESTPHAVGSKDQVPFISVADLTKREVIGLLGKPLETIIVIEGTVKDDYYRKLRADMGETLLLVQSVNGTQLKNEQVFHFEPSQFAQITKPQVGGNFKFTGYETGGFQGLPQDAVQFVGPIQSSGYGFSTSFIILRDEMKTK